jgi:hypothetical protein
MLYVLSGQSFTGPPSIFRVARGGERDLRTRGARQPIRAQDEAKWKAALDRYISETSH